MSTAKKPIVTKISKAQAAKVKAARATYNRVTKIAKESPTKMTRTGIKYSDLADMLNVRGKPLTVSQLERRAKKDVTKILKNYTDMGDLTAMYKKRGEQTRKDILTAIGKREGNSDFRKQLRQYSPGELYTLALAKNYDINKYLFSNSPNSVILKDDTVEAVDEMEGLIIDILDSLGLERGIDVYAKRRR